MHQQIAVPGSPPRCDHATDFVRSFVIVAEREDVYRLQRVTAARDIAKDSLQTEAKRIRIGEQLEAARVLLELVEDSYQRRVIGGLGAAWCGTRPVTDHDQGRQLNDQRVQRDSTVGGASPWRVIWVSTGEKPICRTLRRYVPFPRFENANPPCASVKMRAPPGDSMTTLNGSGSPVWARMTVPRIDCAA